MITYRDAVMDGFSTTGFETTQTAPLTLEIGDGSTNEWRTIKSDEGGIQEKITINFEGFTFDVEPDPDFPVKYAIYLFENGEAEVHRTVTPPGTMPDGYDGANVPHLILAWFDVPAAAVDLADVPIEILTIKDGDPFA